jgi:hypothetical protein
VVLLNSHRIPRVPRYLGADYRDDDLFAYGTITLYGGYFHNLQLRYHFVTLRPDLPPDESRSHNPVYATRSGFNTYTVWAVPISLAATQGIAIAFYSSGY